MASPSFFKIIINSPMPNSPKLNIPLKFAREHEYIFHTEEIYLNVKGAQWKIKLKKTNGRILFSKGWKEFSKFYSLAYGYLLVFRYEGDFCFDVTIFGNNFSEITYPGLTRRDHGEDRPIEDDEFWFENVFEDEDMLDDDKRSIRTDEVAWTLPYRADKTNNKGKGKAQVCLSDDFEDVKPFTMTKSKNASRNKASFGRRALDFTSMAMNPSFSITMGTSYILTDAGKISYLNIPIAFAKHHLKESQEIILQVSDGAIWRVWCGVRLIDQEQRMKVELRDGWKDFVTDNNLEVGDICVFELMEKTPLILFKVSIFQPSS